MATKGMSVFTHQGEDYTINDPNIAPEFDATIANNKGDYVYYQGDLYQFDAAHNANTAWGSRSKTKVKLGDELINLDNKLSVVNGALNNKTENLHENQYNPTELFFSGTANGNSMVEKKQPLFSLKEGNKIELNISANPDTTSFIISFTKAGDDATYYQQTITNQSSVVFSLQNDYNKIAIYNSSSSSVNVEIKLKYFYENEITKTVQNVPQKIENAQQNLYNPNEEFYNGNIISNITFVKKAPLIDLKQGNKVKVKFVLNSTGNTFVIGFTKAGDDATYYQQTTIYDQTEITFTLNDDYAKLGIYYGGGTATTCSVELEHYIVNNLTNKIHDLESYSKRRTFSVIGDSWSAYKYYTNPPTNTAWYPYWETDVQGADNDVDTPDQMWWDIISKSQNISMMENNAYSGSPISYDGYGSGTSDAKEYSFVTRIKSMIFADIIFIEGGTNDSNVGVSLGSYKYSHWVDEDFVYFKPSICFLLDYIKNRHPMSKAYFLINENINTNYKTAIIEACEHYEVPYIMLTGVNRQNGHPSIAGQQTIAEIVGNYLEQE